MKCKKNDCRCHHEMLPLTSVEAIQARKMNLLFQYLRDVQDLNRQLRLLDISEEVAQLQRENDRALGELLVRFGK